MKKDWTLITLVKMAILPCILLLQTDIQVSDTELSYGIFVTVKAYVMRFLGQVNLFYFFKWEIETERQKFYDKSHSLVYV